MGSQTGDERDAATAESVDLNSDSQLQVSQSTIFRTFNWSKVKTAAKEIYS